MCLTDHSWGCYAEHIDFGWQWSEMQFVSMYRQELYFAAK